MNNSRLIVHQYGSPKECVSLVNEDVAPSRSKIKVRVLASPINPADINLICGNYGYKPELPCNLGLEGAAVIEESWFEDYPVGAQVIFIQHVGCWAKELWVDRSEVLVLDKVIDPLQAAMLKVNPMTAWRLLTSFMHLSEGDYIIQNAANSGVGQCVIQLAKILKLKTINLVRREELFDGLKSLGGDLVILDDAKVKDVIFSQLSENECPKLAFNAVGGDSALRLMDCLAPCGKHITFGAMSMLSLKVPNKFLIFKRISLHGLWITEDLKELPKSEVNKIYQSLVTWIHEGKLKQAVGATYPLEAFSTALLHHGQAHRKGKILFQTSNNIEKE
jgi:mitochondrial enoyl-[acyl-carrier protein] reductase / trans-2-enoyl-CoA reductase